MRRILATIVFAVLFGGVGQAQITRHAGSVQIQGTGAEALDNAGGAEFGSGNVELVGTDGKINGPLSTTIIDNLSAVNLTSIPSGQLTGTIDIARFPTGGTWTISSAFTFSSGGQVNIHNTGTNALDVAGGLNIGSGNVALVGTDGKINGPLSTTIIDNLSAVNLTSIPSGQLTGTIDIARFPTGGTWTLASDLTLSAGGNFRVLGGTATIGVNTVTNAVINAPEAMYFNIDSDSTQSNERFIWGHNRATDSGGTLIMRLDEAGLLLLNETANANMAMGLTIQQSTNDNQILALKSSTDVSTGMTTLPLSTYDVESDDYFIIGKQNGPTGGAYIVVVDESDASALHVETWSGAPATTDTTSSLAAVNFFVGQHNGANADVDMAAGSNGFAWGEIDSAGARQTRMILDADSGALWLDGSVEVNLTAPTAPDLTTVYDDNVPSGWARVQNSNISTSLSDDYNVSGATRTGTGIVRVDWDTNMPNTTYVVVVTPHEQSGGRPNTCIADTFLAASVVVTCFLATVQDDTDFSIIAFAGP